MNILILGDFVGCGNVAMGVARSVLTHMGHNALCLPTALISNTWNLGAPAVLDTTAYLQEALAAWERLGIQPEGVLLGYLADEAQTVFIEEQCRRWREKGIKIFLDPIFADNGKLYRGITAAHIAFLKRLLPHIDYVLPNVTEAQFLTGEADSMAAARALVQLGADCAVLTGVETRSSSPVRILRDERLQSALSGLYPCGEGAGYAGGIVSAAVDGIRVAEAVAQGL